MFYRNVWVRQCAAAVVLMLLATTVLAANTAQPAAQRLQQFYRRVHTLSGDFSQVQRDENGKVVNRASGHFVIARPHRFRWTYRQPYQQVIVSNGKTLWTYDKGLSQVTKRPVGQAIKGTPALLLSGTPDLRQAFKLRSLPQSHGLHWVALTPNDPNSGFRELRLGLRQGVVEKMLLKDSLGQISSIEFHHIQVNGPVADGKFEFHPPANADVVQ